MFDTLVQDVRQSFRHLRRSPSFTMTAVLALALAIGANAGVFSIVNGMMLRELAISEPSGLVSIENRGPDDGSRPLPITISDSIVGAGLPVREVCAYNRGTSYAARIGTALVQVRATFIDSVCLSTFGVTPVLGRAFTTDEAPLARAGSPIALLGHGFWLRAFNGDPSVLGKSIRVNDANLTIVGVMPQGFTGIEAEVDVDLFTPFEAVAAAVPGRRPNANNVLLRLAPGASIDEVSSQLSARWTSMLEAVAPAALSPRERARYVDGQPRTTWMGTGASLHRNRYGDALRIALGLTIVLLVLACLNLGGLLLSRMLARASEMSVRRALGAGRGRLARQILVENLMVAIIGAVAALPLAYAVVLPFESFYQLSRSRPTLSLAPDARVFLVIALAAVAAALLMSLIPVWMAARQQRVGLACDRSVARSTSRWGQGLLVVQVALSVVMLAGAGLLSRSLYVLYAQPLGVSPGHLLIVEKEPLPNGYLGIDNKSYYMALFERVRALPGVREVGAARVFPRMWVTPPFDPVFFVGGPEITVQAALEVLMPGQLEALGVPLLAGRLPAWTDDGKAPRVAVVSRRLADQLDPSGNVVGRRIDYGTVPDNQGLEIVGVVGDATMGSLRETALPIVYRPGLQMTPLYIGWSSLAIRHDGDTAPIFAGVRDALEAAGREYVYQASTLDEHVRRSPHNERVGTTLALAAAVVAAMLAFVGVFGLLAYAVARRTREIGVRVAVGADRAAVIRMVLREGLVLTGIGVLIGVPAAIGAGRLIRSLLFGITETDPLTLGAIVVFFLALGAAAGMVPAHRAASIDPAIALRAE